MSAPELDALSPALIGVLAAWAAAAGVGAWCLLRFLGARRSGQAQATRADVRAPLWWRAMAWLIDPLAAHLGPWLSAKSRRDHTEALRQAGLDGVLDTDRFVAGSCAAALAASALAGLLGAPWGGAPAFLVVFAGGLGYALPRSWLSDRRQARQRSVFRQLPFLLDVITLAVQSGMNLGSGLAQAADKLPGGPLREEIHRLLRELRTGRARDDALRAMADRLALPAVASLVSALVIAEQQGSALAPILRAQAEQRRNERFLRAEKLAMQAPVKMLLPLLVFIFPCTFAVLLFPILARLLMEGWLQ